jgi:hypothetical protein
MRKLLEKIDPLKLVVGTLLLTLAFLVLQKSSVPAWIPSIVASLALIGFTILVFKLTDCVSDPFAVILAMWLPMTVTTVAAVLLFYKGQARDLGVGLLGEGNTKLFILFCILLYWAVNNWHSARLGLDYTFPAPTGTEHWLFWSPRLLGVCAHLFAAISLALAGWSLLPLAQGSSPFLKPSDWLVFTAPLSVAGLALLVLPTGGRTWILRATIGGRRRDMGVCTENLIRLMPRWNRLSWRNDRAALFRSGRPSLAIQVEGTA